MCITFSSSPLILDAELKRTANEELCPNKLNSASPFSFRAYRKPPSPYGVIRFISSPCLSFTFRRGSTCCQNVRTAQAFARDIFHKLNFYKGLFVSRSKVLLRTVATDATAYVFA